MSNGGTEMWVPAQFQASQGPDFRYAKFGPRGFKEKNRKRVLEEIEQSAADNQEMDVDMASKDDSNPQGKRQKTSATSYSCVSGRTWKTPAQRANKIMNPVVKSSWDKKQQQKAERQIFLEQKKEAVSLFKNKRKEAAKRKKEAEDRKKINREKSAIVQQITKLDTIKKLSKHKKKKKLLRKTGAIDS